MRARALANSVARTCLTSLRSTWPSSRLASCVSCVSPAGHEPSFSAHDAARAAGVPHLQITVRLGLLFDGFAHKVGDAAASSKRIKSVLVDGHRSARPKNAPVHVRRCVARQKIDGAAAVLVASECSVVLQAVARPILCACAPCQHAVSTARVRWRRRCRTCCTGRLLM